MAQIMSTSDPAELSADTYYEQTHQLYNDLDSAMAEVKRISDRINGITHVHYEAGVRVNDMAQKYDVVPMTIYNRIKRYRQTHGIVRVRRRATNSDG